MRLAALALLVASPAASETGVLVVTITGVRSAKGHVLVAVCDRATFLAPSCAYHGLVPAQVGTVTIRLTGVPPGVYAAQAFQDANDNGKVDQNFFGMPTEGIGFSNDAPILFGPPRFADAAFTLTAAGGAIRFALRYF
ncbi:MAG: DUF2141 domain-containing protein [Acetobacteraceae bacterium]